MIVIFSFGIWTIMFITFLTSGIVNVICMIKLKNKNLMIVKLKKFIYIILAIIRGISCVYLVINAKVDDGAYHSSVSSSYRGYAYRESITYDVFEGFSGGCMIIMLVLLVISILTIVKALFSKKDEDEISFLTVVIGVISRILIYVVGIVMFSYQSNHFSWAPILVGLIDVIATVVGFSLMDDAFEYQQIYSEPSDQIELKEIWESGSSKKNQTNNIEIHKTQNCNNTIYSVDNDCDYCGRKPNITVNNDNRKSVIISEEGIRKCGYCNSEMKDSIYCYNCGKYNKK